MTGRASDTQSASLVHAQRHSSHHPHLPPFLLQSCGPGAYGGDPNMGGGYPPEEFVPVPAHAQTTSDDFIPVNPDMGGDDFVPIDPSQPGDGYVAEGDGGVGVGVSMEDTALRAAAAALWSG